MSLAIPAAIGGFQLLGNILAQNQAGKAAQRRDQFLDGRISDLSTFYKTEINTPFLQTPLAQSVLSRLREEMEQQNDAMNSNAISSGATAETKVAAKSEQNKRYAGALSDIAGLGTQYKANLKSEYQTRLSDLLNMKDQAFAQKQSNWLGLSQGINSAAGGLYQAYGGGAFDFLKKNS